MENLEKQMEEFIKQVDLAFDMAFKVCKGVKIGTRKEDHGQMVYLSYGDKSYSFNATGYNFLFNMHRLYNNPVMNAIFE